MVVIATNESKKSKGGRPKFIIDYEAVEKLASIMCTELEIASFLGCDVRTLQRDEEFCRIYKEGKEKGKMSLRRKQWKLADKSYAMAIFLGKQYLGQRDTVEYKAEDNGVLDRLVEALNGKDK